MMEPRIIKTEKQCRSYLTEIERLAELDPDANSTDGARLELLAKLVEDFENDHFIFGKPDPIDAIVFRMEQQGLRQKDIAPYLGGKNRASEILARKRPLTLPMIRALHENLAIPPELLIREPGAEYSTTEEFDDSQVPVDVLIKRGWLDAQMTVSDLLKRFEEPIGRPVRLRHTLTFGATARTNRTHVWLWLSRVREIADSQTHVSDRFQRDRLNEDLIRYVSRLSYMAKGPRLAREFLEEHGISVVIEPHLPKTHLDGAAMLGRSGTPIIGLTLREDRLDNFWFTLIHELIHVWKHLDGSKRRAIADENIEKHSDTDEIEQEANDRTAEILIPRAVWRRSEAFLDPSAQAIRRLAADLQISPAIVAGRVRYEIQNYSLFSRLVGYRQARANFPELRWA
jgi:HTH-type transcriptional regulator / antitoxin HigA